jgi:hypothetical protein
MPRGPQGQRRPADVIGAAKKLTKEQRQKIAKKASAARWG